MEGRTEDRRHAQGGKRSTGTKEGQVEEDYQQVRNYFTFVYHTSFFCLGTHNGIGRGCERRTRDTHREGKESTRTKEGHVEEDYQQVRNCFTFVYHTSLLLFLLFRNTQWDGRTMHEKDKGRAQGKDGINTDKGSTSGGRLSTGTELFLHLFITLHFFYFFYLGTLNGMERRCRRRTRATHRERKGSTRIREVQVEEGYDLHSFITLHFLYFLYLGTLNEWDGTTMQETDKG